jgi:hypothetical protein
MGKTQFEIESGIPAPKPAGKSKYAVLGTLEMGQSVLFDVSSSNTLSPAIAIYQGRDGKHFVRRKVDGGVRVWRTK